MSIVFESAIGDLFAPRRQICRVQVKTLGHSLRCDDLGCCDDLKFTTVIPAQAHYCPEDLMKLVFGFVIGDLFSPMKKIFPSALKDTGSQPTLGRRVVLR
jgi:hypothetical protein